VVLERAAKQCGKYPEHAPQAFATPAQMIADAGLDACYILLPPFAHGEAERACLNGNVPFLVEKPIGNKIEVLREIRAEVRTKNLITAAGYMNRYQPSVKAAKAAFSGDEAVIAWGGWLGGPPTTDNAYMATSLIGQWWVIKEKSGGQFVEQVTHTVDLVRHFMGDATEVFAHNTTAFNSKLPNLLPNYTMDDAMAVNIRFAGGGIATILSSSATPVGGGVSLKILGTHSALEFSGWGHDAIIRTAQGEETVAAEANIFAVEDRAFIDAVRSGDRSSIMTDYDDAFKTAALTLAANASAANGTPVSAEN
jgi:predicted dehydrogenase